MARVQLALEPDCVPPSLEGVCTTVFGGIRIEYPGDRLEIRDQMLHFLQREAEPRASSGEVVAVNLAAVSWIDYSDEKGRNG